MDIFRSGERRDLMLLAGEMIVSGGMRMGLVSRMGVVLSLNALLLILSISVWFSVLISVGTGVPSSLTFSGLFSASNSEMVSIVVSTSVLFSWLTVVAGSNTSFFDDRSPSSNRALKTRAHSRANSRCCSWSCPTGTWVALMS